MSEDHVVIRQLSREVQESLSGWQAEGIEFREPAGPRGKWHALAGSVIVAEADTLGGLLEKLEGQVMLIIQTFEDAVATEGEALANAILRLMNADHGEFAETETTIRVSWSVEGHDLSGQITYTIMPPES